jgi:hypothetical protein
MESLKIEAKQMGLIREMLRKAIFRLFRAGRAFVERTCEDAWADPTPSRVPRIIADELKCACGQAVVRPLFAV